jgi:hypothetical protein
LWPHSNYGQALRFEVIWPIITFILNLSSDIEAERLEYLIKNGYDFDLHANPSTGDLPVHYLGAHGSTNTFRLLGEDRMKTKNEKGWTAAHFACHLGRTRSAAHLFRAYPSLMDIKNADDKVEWVI